MQGVKLYIENLERKFGRVDESLSNVLFNRHRVDEQIKAMFPAYTGQADVPKEDDANNDAEDENIDTDDHEVPAKRSRSSSQETIAPELFDLTFVLDNSAANNPSSEDNDDDLNESMAKLHGEIKNRNSSNKRKICDLQTELKRHKEAHAECQVKYDTLQDQLNAAALKQAEEVAELKNGHSKEVNAIKEAHNKEIDEMKNAQNMDLGAQLQAKEAVIAKLKEANSKQEMELRIKTNFLEKAKQDVDALKKCTGCRKRLDRRCAACNAIWYDDCPSQSI